MGVNVIYEVGAVGVWMYDCGMRDSCVTSPDLQSEACVLCLPAITDLPR